MRDMFDQNLPVDPVSLADHLKSEGELDRVGGMPYLLDLANAPFALASWRHHAEMLRRDATLRQIIAASARSRRWPSTPPRTPRRSSTPPSA